MHDGVCGSQLEHKLGEEQLDLFNDHHYSNLSPGAFNMWEIVECHSRRLRSTAEESRS